MAGPTKKQKVILVSTYGFFHLFCHIICEYCLISSHSVRRSAPGDNKSCLVTVIGTRAPHLCRYVVRTLVSRLASVTHR